MSRKSSFLALLFLCIMFVFVLFAVWYLPSAGTLRFQLDDVQKSLETSFGREKKQQMEYDEVAAALPAAQEELDRLLPLAEEAQNTVKSLKEERKTLRQEKKDLEKSTEQGKNQGDGEEWTNH